MRNIDTLCEAMEQEENTSRDSKRRNLFPNETSSSAEPPITAIQRYQAPERSISGPKVGITIEELSVLSRDEVFPFLNRTRLKDQKVVSIDPVIFQGGASSRNTSAPWEMDLSAAGLKKLVDFPVKGKCRRIEIRSRLGHEKQDKQSVKMFREGWMAIVGIVRSDFMAKEAASRGNPLLLEAQNAFTDTRAEWDSEKGELVRQSNALKVELEKAEQKALEAKEREEAVRKEKETLQ
ncbi:hypothetical protein R1sor_017639 [Riccia sorocarpa]|uniref:Uncharacterized protein n=1 Tax=Riccia sorocarpa TaxID=122646 RepID=A0ABD3I7I2_9MARC